tara:strand:+ start:2569 stop:3192 length:624 start_codon:yes stop_codon:yes gene_type:complete
MTLPSSGSLSLNDIRGEFGGPSSNVAIDTYYRNGTYVYTVTKNLSIPTSGQIDFGDFYGSEGVGVYGKGSASSAATGGKASVTYSGVDTQGHFTSSFGSWSDTSVTVGSTGRTVRSFTSNASNVAPPFNVDFNVGSSIFTNVFFQVYSTSSLLVDMKVKSPSHYASTIETWTGLNGVTAEYGPNSPILGSMPSSGTFYLVCNKGSFT